MSMRLKPLHNISLLVNHRPGVLIRVALVFSRRGYNIESLVVSEANNPRFAHMIIAASGDTQTLEQIIKQLSKLVDVMHVAEYDKGNTIHRELGLMKIAVTREQRSEVLQLIHALKGTAIEIGESHCIAQISGTPQELDNAITVLKDFSISEVIRTGTLLMRMGSDST